MEEKYVLLPADDAVQNWFEENVDKECSASSAVYKFRLWLESLVTRQVGAVWVKGAPTERKQYFAKVPSQIDDNLYHDAIIWPTQRAAHWYAAGNGFNFVVHDNEVIAYLAESATTANVLPTFWDVAKAFKWATEYRDEIGGHLTLYNDQWTIISEDEDGNENETQDLTPGNVAELYCLQKGFTKDVNESPAGGREEDANRCSVFVPCTEDDPDCCGGYTSTDGQSLCYVKEVLVPLSAFKQPKNP